MKFVISHLSKHFEKKEVLRDIDFAFEDGKIYGLLGRNGAGKTTLFNCINGDLKADGGTFSLEENGQLRPMKSDDIGYVLSTPTVPEFLTGREFLKFFIDINRERIPQTAEPDAYFDYVSIAPDDRDKLLNGLLRASEKRPVTLAMLEHIVDEIEANLHNSLDREVSSVHIGELAMEKLREVDEVAYVRFASVYRQFKDIQTFMEELKALLNEQ